MILTESEKDSMRRFMRVESPLVANTRSIRNEVEQGKAVADGEGKNTEITDPFAGIDFENLPEDVRASLEKAKGSFATLQTENTESKKLATKNEKIAREQQARADRNYEQLRKHNLVNSDGTSSINSEGGEDAAKIEALAKSFVAKIPSLNIESARLQATLLIEAQKSFKPELYKEIGAGLSPALSTVGNLYAEKLLVESQLPKNDPQGILQIPEIMEMVNSGIANLVQQGTTITSDTILNLKDMAFGRHVAALKPEERAKFFDMKPESKQQQFSTAGHFGGQGNFAMLQQNREASGKPIAANGDTATAVDATLASMKRGMTFGKGKGK